jgi:hypothetical protein
MRFLVVFRLAAPAAAAAILSQSHQTQPNEISHRWFARRSAIVRWFDQTE